MHFPIASWCRVEEVISCEDFACDDRGATASTEDNQVMLVMHGESLVYLQSEVQVPVTRPQ